MVAYGYRHGWLKVAFGIFCLGKTFGGIFCLGKTCCRHLLTGGMCRLLQRIIVTFKSKITQVLDLKLYIPMFLL